jgi:mono/diheme cytochrome c family protein
MRASVVVVVSVLVMAANITWAQQKPRVEQAPIQNIAPIDGPGMFSAYCAPCHGKGAKGDGPAAPALKRAPADLTTLAVRNGGTFPATRVKRFIQGLDTVTAHGTREMPMWGTLFRQLSPDTAELRAENLTDYVKSLQQ